MSPEPSLAPHVRRRSPAVLRFLDAAIALERPAVDALVAAGVPRYDAHDLQRRLTLAGELVDDRWHPAAREAYRALMVVVEPPRRRLQRLPEGERPREKALHAGVGTLTDGELLALLLRTGGAGAGVLEFAQRLLEEHDGLLGLAGRDVAELAQAEGLGPARSAELAAAFELGRRLARARRRERPPMRSPEEVMEHLGADLAPLGHEELWCLPLDARSRLIGEPRVVSRGDVDGTEAGPRAFFRTALRAGAVTAIAVHNHPTGDVEPSAADRLVTRRLVEAGRHLDLHLVDHLVIGDGGRFTSLRREHPDLFR